MSPDKVNAAAQLLAEFRETGRKLMVTIEQRLSSLPRADQSGWFYIATVAADTADGRHQATVKLLSQPVGPSNQELGPFPCLRGYTPIAGQKVLVRWVAGSRSDGVIEG
jgi:hypothetical protein